MLALFFYLCVSILICLGLNGLMGVTYKTNPNKEKSRPFERGFDPAGNTRLQFCIKFFLVGVIFLIFDVEVRLIIPLPFSQEFILLFVILLTLGLIYEWYYGGLEWF